MIGLYWCLLLTAYLPGSLRKYQSIFPFDRFRIPFCLRDSDLGRGLHSRTYQITPVHHLIPQTIEVAFRPIQLDEHLPSGLYLAMA
jgi:hypothetical protein